MKIADFFRGVEGIVAADIVKIFTVAKSALTAAPLPANIKTDLGQALTDAQADIGSVASLAGSLLGSAIADGVDDLTTLLMNTTMSISSSGGDLSKLSLAEKAALQSTWTAMRAQGDTLAAQLMSGLNPGAPAVVAPPNPAPQSQNAGA